MSSRIRNGVAIAAFVTLAGACATDPVATTALDSSLDPGTSFSPISLSQAQTEMVSSGIRIGVRIKAGPPLVATELFLDPPALRNEPEEVQANITALDQSAGSGTITTDLGVKIGFDGNTVFSRDESDAALSAEQFASTVVAALAAGGHLHVTARRAPPDNPQGPTDGAFLADHIRIGATGDALRMDLNAGRDNLQLNSSPPPDAFLKLLGVTIQIRISDGTTRIGHREGQPGQRVEFEGDVKSVNVPEQSVLLANGMVLRLGSQSVIAPVEHLNSLAEVAAALAGGATVKATGVGLLVTEQPRILGVLTVKFESRPWVTEFQEGVKGVDAAGQKLTLTNGAVLCLDDQTVISTEGDFTSLADVGTALAAGKMVGAAGVATVAPEGAGCRAKIVKVKFTLRTPPPPPATEFHDVVKAADAEGRKITLSNDVVLCFTDGSVIDQEGALKSLAEVVAALGAGKIVGVAGTATAAATASACRGNIVKVRFSVTTPPPPTTEFHEGLASVNLDGKRIVLSNAVVLCLNAESIINQDTDLKTLEAVAAALAAGKHVRADGVAKPGTDSVMCRGIVVSVRFSIVT